MRVKLDLATLAARERQLREELKELRAKHRALVRADRERRLARIQRLARKLRLDRLDEAQLEAALARIAAETAPPPSKPEAEAAAGAVRPQPAAAQETAPAAAETAERAVTTRRWFGV